eukprot:3238850-Amphidinium_carterae.1
MAWFVKGDLLVNGRRLLQGLLYLQSNSPAVRVWLTCALVMNILALQRKTLVDAFYMSVITLSTVGADKQRQ